MPRRTCLPRVVALAAVTLSLGSARAADLFVPGDFPDIQSAIDASAPADIIHVGPGTWPGALTSFNKHLTLRGAGAELTIIDGLGAARVLDVTGSSGLLQVHDVTLTGGLDGAVSTGSIPLQLVDCIVRDNGGVGAYGLVAAFGSSFLDNGGHGLSEFASATGCTFQGNGGWGAIDLSAFVSSSPPPIVGCRFLGNGLGGLRLATYTVSPLFPGDLYVYDSIFRDDNLQLSPLVPGGEGKSTLINCSLLGGTVKVMHGNLFVEASILRSATPITDLASEPNAIAVNYSDIQGGWPFGTDNIDADPLWAAPQDGDFSLLPGSPCINTGSPFLGLDPDASSADMGAVAYHPWSELGGGVAGTGGLARLKGSGPLIAGKPLSLELESATPGAGALLLVGLTGLGAPFKGGTLWPQPDVVIGPLVVDGFGGVELGGSWPAGLSSGFSLWAQAWWTDAAAVQGLAASTGLKGTQP